MNAPTVESEAAFDVFSRTYDAAVNNSLAFTGLSLDFFTRVKAGYIKDIVGARFVHPGAVDMLDLGCGIGNYHKHLAGFTRTLSGCDVSGACIATARANNPGVAYASYQGLGLPYPDASFDVVYTICVMHHVPPGDWGAFTKEMRRVLRPDGVALVFEHNPLNPLTRRAVANCEFDKDAVLLGSSQVQDLLGAAGFASVRGAYILSVPAGNRPMRAIDRLFSRLPFGAQYVVEGRAP